MRYEEYAVGRLESVPYEHIALKVFRHTIPLRERDEEFRIAEHAGLVYKIFGEKVKGIERLVKRYRTSRFRI